MWCHHRAITLVPRHIIFITRAPCPLFPPVTLFLSVIVAPKADVLVAGEIGYSFGTTYTSLTGFYDKTISNAGKLQLILLGKWLQRSGYSFWNFGHPPRRLIDSYGRYKLAPTGTKRLTQVHFNTSFKLSVFLRLQIENSMTETSTRG